MLKPLQKLFNISHLATFQTFWSFVLKILKIVFGVFPLKFNNHNSLTVIILGMKLKPLNHIFNPVFFLRKIPQS